MSDPKHLSRLKRRIRYRVAFWLSVWFGCGLVPVAPGTVGTLGALPLYFLVAPFGPWAVLATAIAITVIGIWSAGVVSRVKRAHDPQIIVIDEVAGLLVTLSVAPADWKGVVVGVVLFRLFDQTKPFPAGRAEKLPAGYGVVLDDVIAGIWAGAFLLLAQLAHWL